MDTFDVTDKDSWYFGSISRQDATEVLMNEGECGMFLVRDSRSIAGDYVLCVREDSKVSNYIINKIHENDQIIFRIGDQSFENLPKLLTFYTLHYLDTTPLRKPAPKRIERVVAKFDFSSSDQDDLPFRRGEILTVLKKDEDQWWTAKNIFGRIGQIPVPYVQKYDESIENIVEGPFSCSSKNCDSSRHTRALPVASDTFPTLSSIQQLSVTLKRTDLNKKLPALARVKQARIPNAYDRTALKLEVGDVIRVTKTNINGQWEGEYKGKRGHFPFTHVEFIDENDCNSKDSISVSTKEQSVEEHAVNNTNWDK